MVYMEIVVTFLFDAFLLGVLSCIGTLYLEVTPATKEFQNLPPERALVDFALLNLVLHLVIMNLWS
ncbi:hypothetical protein KC19_1G179400 [Ceratodon purpureus]|uniref:Dolichyl-diphosphooligosaccharide--protein glycosyltransferase subunit DAD1 n=1 Tax=Ceratodon purpureus TaxID=3225 RepID=A0A8T0J8D1_CERPU|nr:hypothetical protein KC19_1G179400 [Ceratodon purpureus]